jgi:hypothetical protein
MRNHSVSMIVTVAMAGASMTGCLSDGNVESESADIGATPSISAFVMTVQTDYEHIDVSSSKSSIDSCFEGSCNFAYLGGSSLAIRVPFTKDQIDCELFHGWSGACAGQGATCTLVINSNLTTRAIWVPLLGCKPR